MLKQKAQVIIDLYLDSQIPPTTQLDINHETQQKLLKSATKITQGTFTPAELAVFDEVRAQLFKDLLPYYAGFKSNVKEDIVVISKQDKVLKERLEELLNMKNPSPNDFKLPPLSPQPFMPSPNSMFLMNNSRHGTIALEKPPQSSMNIVFSISTGIKYRDDKNALNTGRNSLAGSYDRRNSQALNSNNLNNNLNNLQQVHIK